jgi:hypothetical protein
VRNAAAFVSGRYGCVSDEASRMPLIALLVEDAHGSPEVDGYVGATSSAP